MWPRVLPYFLLTCILLIAWDNIDPCCQGLTDHSPSPPTPDPQPPAAGPILLDRWHVLHSCQLQQVQPTAESSRYRLRTCIHRKINKSVNNSKKSLDEWTLCFAMILFWYLYFMLPINARLHPHYRQILTKVLDGSRCMLQGSPQQRSR